MATPGRKPKPKIVHINNGNPSKLPLASLTEGARVPVEIPEAPDHLDDDAVAEWGRISIELQKLGLIAKVDRAALGVYCQAYSRWRKAELQMRNLEGEDALIDTAQSGYKQIGVWLQISNRAVDQMQKFMAEFGMTPSSRSRVSVSIQAGTSGNDGDKGQEKPDPAKKYF